MRKLSLANDDDARAMTGTVLYIIGPKRGPVKIGITGSTEARLKQLQTGHPYELFVLAEVAVPYNGLETEESIHNFLVPYRIRPNGEWFHRTHEVLRLIDMVACRLLPDQIMDKMRAARSADWEKNRNTWAASRAHQRREQAARTK